MVFATGCFKPMERFGYSETKEEAKATGSTVIEYIPAKTSFKLLDSTEMTIDTAWTEISFTYYRGEKNVFDTADGYHFSVPYHKQGDHLVFRFALADADNTKFTSNISETIGRLYPKHLYDTMRLIIEQKSADPVFPWANPIITDTILFMKLAR